MFDFGILRYDEARGYVYLRCEQPTDPNHSVSCRMAWYPHGGVGIVHYEGFKFIESGDVGH